MPDLRRRLDLGLYLGAALASGCFQAAPAVAQQVDTARYEVGCLGERGDTAFIDTLAAGAAFYDAKTAPQLLVVRYAAGTLVVYSCARPPWSRKLEDIGPGSGGDGVV